MVSKQLGSLGNTSLVIGSDSPYLDCFDSLPKEEAIKPLLLNTKFQRIKNSATKLARVLVIDETPPPINRQTTAPAVKDKTTRDTAAHTRMSSASSADCDQTVSFKYNKQCQAPQQVMYYPEKLHVTSQKDCEAINARIMKQIMKQKMSKHLTFYQAKLDKKPVAVSQSGRDKKA